MRARTSNRTAISGKDAVVIVRLMPHKEFEVFWTLISRLGNYCLMWIVVAFLEYLNAWEITNPNEQFQAAQEVGLGLLTGTPAPEDGKYDFFLVHVLTSSHAIRILLPLIPSKFHVSLLRQWWLFALAVYIAQMRPEIDMDSVMPGPGSEKTWKHVVDKALNGPHSTDAHYVKGEP